VRISALLLAASLTAGCVGGPSGEEGTRQGTAYLDLGVAYLQQGKPRSALQALRKAKRRNSGNARVHNALGLTYQQLSFVERARSAFERAVELAPDDPQVRNNYGAFLANRGDFAASARQFRKALNNPVYSTPETAYYNLGWIARRQGRPGEAEQRLRTALKLRPDYAQARLSLARVLAEQDRLAPARQELARLLERHPDLNAGHLLAGELALEAGNREAARRHLQKVVDHSPQGAAGQRARQLLRELSDPETANQGRKG
jgi:type IV pilus assembly protein PilF